MIDQGDGTIGKRLELGLCPKCQTKLEDEHHYKRCNSCGLIVSFTKIEKEQKEPDTP